MGTLFTNDNGEEVGLCPDCNKIKPASHFILRKETSNQFRTCYGCRREQSRERTKKGAEIRHSIMLAAGGCVWPGCHMRYPQDLAGNFALDHIDPLLKLHVRETNSKWVYINQEEFWSRVAPNLQVLCNHHNLLKSAQERRVGGILHTDPWDEDETDFEPIDFNEIKPVLPGFEEFANPLT